MIKAIISILILGFMITGCTPGIYQRLDSTAPQHGLIFPGITRQDAERYLGPPLLSIRLDKNHYQNIYAYELERSNTDILVTDIMDFVTFDLGNEIISPIDRFSGTRHLIAITYYGADQDTSNDQITSITDKFLGERQNLSQDLLSGLKSALKTVQVPIRWIGSSVSSLKRGNQSSQ
jgi:hypothetical protein